MKISRSPATKLSDISIDTDLVMGGNDIEIGAGKLKAATLYLEEYTTAAMMVRRISDNAQLSMNMASCWVAIRLGFLTDNAYFDSYDHDDACISLRARDNGVGLVEVARIAGGVTPTFDLMAGRLQDHLACAGYGLDGRKVLQGNIEAINAAGHWQHSNDTYTKQHTLLSKIKGTFRVRFGLNATGAGYYVYGRIYKDGVGYGTERTVLGTSIVYFEEDLTFEIDEEIQLYTRGHTPGSTVRSQNFSLRVNETEIYSAY